MIDRKCYEVLGARIYGKKHGLDRVCATRHQQQIYIFLTQVHKETWVGLAVKLWGSISCAGVTPRIKHSRARKCQHKHEIFFVFFKRFHLLSSRLFRRGSFHEETNNIFLRQNGLNKYRTF
jgi:hypothetical protein